MNLWKQQLGTLPASLLDNTALETLILADNSLDRAARRHRRADQPAHARSRSQPARGDLPESLGQLAGLTDYSYLHDNQLTALRESLFSRLIRLRYLNVSDNRLTQLPAIDRQPVEPRGAAGGQQSARDAAAVVRRARASARAAPARTTSSRSCRCRCAACRSSGVSRSARQPVHRAAATGSLEWPNLQKLDLRWVKLSSMPPAVGALEERGCRVLL